MKKYIFMLLVLMSIAWIGCADSAKRKDKNKANLQKDQTDILTKNVKRKPLDK